MRAVFVCSALVFANLVYGGSYQRTRDGQTLVWRDVPVRGDEATWSGKRDKDGYATGSGVLTWYKTQPSVVTGSNILDTRRYVILINHYSGTMVRGKFKGAVTYVNAGGKPLQPITAKQTNRANRRQKIAESRGARVRATPAPEEAAMPTRYPIIVETPERTSAQPSPAATAEESPSRNAEQSESSVSSDTVALAGTPGPTAPELAPERSPLPTTQATVPPTIDTLEAKHITTAPSDQQPPEPDARTRSVPDASQSDDSVGSPSTPRFELPKPPRTIDTETVARLDAVYQSAVKANDAGIMDEILADDFVLITQGGDSLTKADLIKEARGKRTLYDHQEVEEGTQKVRIWRDTAVVTALLRIAGTRDKNPFDYKVWVSETYVRTPTGWRYVFGQPLKSDTE